MSDKEAGISILRRQRSYLRTWSKSVARMIDETPKGDAQHWELIQERDSLQKEINRVSHRLRQIA